MRYLRLILLVASLPAVPASRAEAQHSRPVAYRHETRPAQVRLTLPKSREAHIVTGALLGTVLTVGAIVVYENRVHSESLAGPFAYAPVVVLGAAVGGGIGYVVWRIRR